MQKPLKKTAVAVIGLTVTGCCTAAPLVVYQAFQSSVVTEAAGKALVSVVTQTTDVIKNDGRSIIRQVADVPAQVLGPLLPNKQVKRSTDAAPQPSPATKPVSQKVTAHGHR